MRSMKKLWCHLYFNGVSYQWLADFIEILVLDINADSLGDLFGDLFVSDTSFSANIVYHQKKIYIYILHYTLPGLS